MKLIQKKITAPIEIETEIYSTQIIIPKYYKYIKSKVFFLLKKATFDKAVHAALRHLTSFCIHVNKFVQNLYTWN